MSPNITWPAVEKEFVRSSSLGGFQKQGSNVRQFLFYNNFLNSPREIIHALPLEKFTVKGFDNLYHIFTITHGEGLFYIFKFRNTKTMVIILLKSLF